MNLSTNINAEIEISKLRKTAYNNFNGPAKITSLPPNKR
jgi:hypothetical protein